MTHLGNARRAAGQLAGAEEVLREALVLRPVGPEAAATYNSLGAVLQVDDTAAMTVRSALALAEEALQRQEEEELQRQAAERSEMRRWQRCD